MYTISKISRQAVFPSAILLFTSCSDNAVTTQTTGEAYVKEINAWDAKRAESLKAEDGWLNVAGRFTLMAGRSSIGSDSGCTIVFPAGKAPDTLGYITVSDSIVSFESAPGVKVHDEANMPFTAGPVFDTKGLSKTLGFGSLRWFIIERSGKFILRLRDLESDALKNFSGIERFPVDESWRIEADFEPAKEELSMAFDNVIGTTTTMPFMGTLHFEKDGKKYSLNAVLDEDLFIVFADQTTGKETYHSGRFLHADIPKEGEKVILDFNKAYNPPCAFTDFATCPLPRKENRLSLRVEAGEKGYGH